MPDLPIGPPAPPEPLESERREFLSAWFQLLGKYAKWRSFRATRSLVLSGEPIYNLPASDRTQRGLMNPAAFNLYQSAASALPSLLLVALFAFVYPVEKVTESQVLAGAAELEGRAADFFVSFWSTTRPLFLPLVLFAAAGLAALGSIRRRDLSPSRWRRTVRAYLYFDGALGLWPQAMLSVGYVGIAELNARRINSPLSWALLAGVAGLGMLWQASFTQGAIPRALFQLNNYGTGIRRWRDILRLRRHPGEGPWGRYQFFTLVPCPFVALGTYWALWWVCVILARTVAALQAAVLVQTNS